MCGRFTQDIDESDLDDLYSLSGESGVPAPKRRWNGSPTQEFALCRLNVSGGREIAIHRWGLIPSWARDPKIGARMINARSETVDSKPSFRSAFRRRRCLVPASGWFEWQRDESGKQPWWISPEGGPFSFAGLWEVWDKGAGPVSSFVILTCPASDALRYVHERQPSIIAKERYREWLDPAAPRGELLELVRSPVAGPFECRRVGRAVNSSRHDFPDLLRAV